MTLPLESVSHGLVYRCGAEVHVGVAPVRAIPIAAPTEGLSLVSTEGHELAWVARLHFIVRDVAALDRGSRRLLERFL